MASSGSLGSLLPFFATLSFIFSGDKLPKKVIFLRSHKNVVSTPKNVALILNIHIRKECPKKEYDSTYGHYSCNTKLSGAIDLDRDTSWG
jgi:hypothetical protein